MDKWFLLPGMGATAAMYNALRHKLDFDIDFINWPVYRGETTYAEVARRAIDENGIEPADVVGGSSLGGMVALEIGRLVQPKAVVLLGSAVNPSDVQGLLTLLSPLAAITPISLVQLLAGKQKNVVSAMFAESNTQFIRAMCTYVPHWKGYAEPATRVFRLHGAQDMIIPCPSSGATVVREAGHLVAMTHAAETAAFLREVRAQVGPF